MATRRGRLLLTNFAQAQTQGVVQRAQNKTHFCTTVLNSGSCARDHLANERTFLAWARTGLGFLGAGTGIFCAYAFGYVDSESIQFNSLSTGVHPEDVLPSCALLWANGAGFLGFAVKRYFDNLKAIQAGQFIISKGGIIGVTVASSLSTAVAVGLVIQKETAQLATSLQAKREAAKADAAAVAAQKQDTESDTASESRNVPADTPAAEK